MTLGIISQAYKLRLEVYSVFPRSIGHRRKQRGRIKNN